MYLRSAWLFITSLWWAQLKVELMLYLALFTSVFSGRINSHFRCKRAKKKWFMHILSATAFESNPKNKYANEQQQRKFGVLSGEKQYYGYYSKQYLSIFEIYIIYTIWFGVIFMEFFMKMHSIEMHSCQNNLSYGIYLFMNLPTGFVYYYFLLFCFFSRSFQFRSFFVVVVVLVSMIHFCTRSQIRQSSRTSRAQNRIGIVNNTVYDACILLNFFRFWFDSDE